MTLRWMMAHGWHYSSKIGSWRGDKSRLYGVGANSFATQIVSTRANITACLSGFSNIGIKKGAEVTLAFSASHQLDINWRLLEA